MELSLFPNLHADGTCATGFHVVHFLLARIAFTCTSCRYIMVEAMRLVLWLSVGLLTITLVTLNVCHRAKLLRPHVVQRTGPKTLMGSDVGLHYDAHDARLIGDWIAAHQTGWKFGSILDFDPAKPQFSGDNYTIGIEGETILFDYYEKESDETNDPDSFVIIKRQLSPNDQAFWGALISRIKKASHR